MNSEDQFQTNGIKSKCFIRKNRQYINKCPYLKSKRSQINSISNGQRTILNFGNHLKIDKLKSTKLNYKMANQIQKFTIYFKPSIKDLKNKIYKNCKTSLNESPIREKIACYSKYKHNHYHSPIFEANNKKQRNVEKGKNYEKKKSPYNVEIKKQKNKNFLNKGRKINKNEDIVKHRNNYVAKVHFNRFN